ncbi:hypothetical protein M8C21_031006, partial [Ambrosia artemisiifolia]
MCGKQPLQCCSLRGESSKCWFRNLRSIGNDLSQFVLLRPRSRSLKKKSLPNLNRKKEEENAAMAMKRRKTYGCSF